MRLYRILAVAAALSLFALTPAVRAATPSSEAADGAVLLRDLPGVKARQREIVNEGEKRIREARERRSARARHATAKKHGAHVRPVRPEEGAAFDESPVRVRATSDAARPAAGTLATPNNVRLNNPSGDGANAGQSELSVAMLGQYGLAGWNNGQGFISGPKGQSVSYTTDGGATWTDVGLPPRNGTITDWSSDPVVAVNEKTGEFWFSSLTDNGSSDNGIAVVRATFPGGVFTWGTPHVVYDLNSSTDFLDKEWLVADSTSGNLYLSYTHFIVNGGDIGFVRSTDGGVNWSSEQLVSNNNGNVQGSRPMVAGDGSVYVTWYELGPVDADDVMIRASHDHGLSFGTQHSAVHFYDNFGTGAPGFNRNRNVLEPCAAVDRSSGPHRGRLYATVGQSLNYFDDPIGGGGSKVEVENDNFFNRATPFTPGQKLRGALSTTTDFDYFSFNATAGTSYIFFCDSIPRPLYTMRVFCGSDTLTRLAYSGDQDAPAGGQGLIVWTAPTSGTYYLRMAFVQVTGGSNLLGGYRIQTGIAAHGSEVGRDQRDVTVSYSDDSGTTWSSPVRVGDDAPLYDDFLPEVGVTVEGYPYCAWYDWRDANANCGGRSNVYLTRSTDGGVTWAPNHVVTTAQTAWTTAPTNIAPNMGDYIGLYAGNALALGWGDCRAGEADVNAWGSVVTVDQDLGCPSDTAVAANSILTVNLPLTNHNTVFDNNYDVTVAGDRGWPASVTATPVPVTANGATANATITITVPDTATGSSVFCVTTSLAGANPKRCCFTVTATHTNGVNEVVRAGFGIHSISPNPAVVGAAVAFALPNGSPARLELLDLSGRRVAEREVGSMGPGQHVVRFDREIRTLPAGIYAVRLTQEGRTANSKLTLVR